MTNNTSFANRVSPAGHNGVEANQLSRRLLVIATVVTLVLNFVPYSNYLLYPLRLFVTFIHESGHALAALISGGGVQSITVFPNGEGVTGVYVSPLWAWLSLSGGYLGTAVFGALLLQVGRLSRAQNTGRLALLFGAGAILLLTLLYARDPFTLGLGIVLSLGFFGMARLLSPQAALFTVAFLAVQCCLNALGDLSILFHLTAAGSGHNDAGFMAQQYGLPPMFWAISWSIAALLLLFVSLRSFWQATASRGERSL